MPQSNIEYKEVDGDWTSGRILGRAGKSTGKYRSHWNVERLDDRSVDEINVDTMEWRQTEADETENVLISYSFSEVFASQMNADLEDAKMTVKKLSNMCPSNIGIIQLFVISKLCTGYVLFK